MSPDAPIVSGGRPKPEEPVGLGSTILEARGLTRTFRTPQRNLEILRGASLEVRAGELLVIVGASGVGKSTLLHLLGGLDTPTSGQVLFRGQAIHAWSADRLAAFRNRSIGFVFQFHHLLPEFSALENIMLPALVGGTGAAQARAAAVALLEEVGLSARMEHRPDELSGGEQQRVAVARSLVNRPEVVLADEPSGNLDRNTAGELHRVLRSLAESHRQAFVIVTHDDAIAAIADRVFVLAEGVLREGASPHPER